MITFHAFDAAAGRIRLEDTWQIELPPYFQDLISAGKKASTGWMFTNSLNTEMCTGGNLEGKPAMEVGASKNEMDYVHVINWKKAEELGCTFNIFLAPHQVGQVARMAERFPGGNVVIRHRAMIDITAPDEKGFGPLLDLARLPNVYVRTSLHNPSKTKELPFRDVWPFLRRVYDRFGPRRLVWANFHELLIMKEIIPFFTAEDKEWILGRTAHRLYRLPA